MIIIDCFFLHCHCITPEKLCLSVHLLLILWFHIHEGSVNISSVAFNVHLQYLTLNKSWFALKKIEYARSPDKYSSCFTWILVLIEPLHIFSVSSRKLQIILSVLKNVFKGLKISSLKAKRKIFFLVEESGDSNDPVTKKKYVQIISNYYWTRLSKILWFVSGERNPDK